MSTTSIHPNNADRQERTRALLTKLEEGFQAVKESDRFTEYLKFCSRFHNYSPQNCMLILMQKPLASHVAGFQTWKNVGRYVKKGERGIQILAPRPWKRTAENEDGEEETIEGVGFVPVHVFDVSQTDGAELPSPNERLTGDDYGLFQTLQAVAEREGLSISQGPMEVTANGFYRRTDKMVWIRPGMSPAQSAKTLAHELAHHFAQHDVNGHCRGEAETIAESAAYIVLAHFGIDAGAYSFGYLASWTDAKVFKAALKDIQRVAQQIIDGLGKVEGSVMAAPQPAPITVQPEPVSVDPEPVKIQAVQNNPLEQMSIDLSGWMHVAFDFRTSALESITIKRNLPMPAAIKTAWPNIGTKLGALSVLQLRKCIADAQVRTGHTRHVNVKTGPRSEMNVHPALRNYYLDQIAAIRKDVYQWADERPEYKLAA